MEMDYKLLKSMSSTKYYKNKVSKNNKKLTNELSNSITILGNHLLESKIEKTANWILEEDLWLQNENDSLKINKYSYERGDIISLVNLGTTNLGTEIRYPHPCVTLYDGGDWVFVAPITAATMDVDNNPFVFLPFEVYTDKSKKKSKNSNEFFFKKPTVIQVDQCRRVSKNRIVTKKRYKIRPELLNQIDNVLLKYYIPQKFKLLEEFKSTINTIKKDNFELRKTIERQSKTIDTLEILLKKPNENKKVVDK